MKIIKIIFPQILDVGCFSHTVDLLGDKFMTPTLDEFISAWVLLFSHSPKSRLLWKERTGKSVKTLSKTQWWSRWEVIDEVMLLFGDIELFLMEHDELGPRTRVRMLTILQDPIKRAMLMVEMAAVVDAGGEFVKTTYALEGDGPLVLYCYEQIQAAFESVSVQHYPNVDAVISHISNGAPIHIVNQWKAFSLNCVKPAMDFFVNQF